MNFEKIVDAYIAGSPHRKALNKKEFDYLFSKPCFGSTTDVVALTERRATLES